MRKPVLTALAAVLITLSIDITPAAAQPTSQPPTLAELQRMQDSATTTDPDIERYLPRWRINEADLKIKLAQYFKLDGIPVRETDSMTVTATFPKPETNEQDILSIRVGGNAVLSGGQKIRTELGEALYNRILEKGYAHSDIPPATPLTSGPATRIPNVLQPTNARQFIAVSAFRQAVQLGTTGARLEHNIGNDEIGYHFWSSGQGKAVLHYPIIQLQDPVLRAAGVPDVLTVQLGAAYRMKFGMPQDEFLGGVIQPRLLNGNTGVKAVTRIDYRLPQVNDIGLTLNTEIPFNKLQGYEQVNLGDGGIVTVMEQTNRTNQFNEAAYFLRTVAQGSVFWETWLNDYEHFFRISLGASYQEVARAVLADANGNPSTFTEATRDDVLLRATGVNYTNLIHPTEMEDWIFAKVEYLNQSGFPFGISAQLANRNLLLDGFIPLLPNWLFIQAKFSTPILRDSPAPWEQESFFMISPVLRFMID